MPKLNAITAPFPRTIHGIDPYAPGGIEKLFAHHRSTFGNAVMEAGAGGDGGSGDGGTGGGAGNDGGSGSGGQGGSGTGGQGGDGDGGDEQLGEGGKKALKAERDLRSKAEKDLADAQTELQRLRDAGKSDDERRQERFQQLEQSDREKDTTITTQQGTILRYQVAAAKGLDLEAAERLRGATKEEIEADADTWIQKWGTSKDSGAIPGVGARGANHIQSSPGLGTLRAGYEQSSSK